MLQRIRNGAGGVYICRAVCPYPQQSKRRPKPQHVHNMDKYRQHGQPPHIEEITSPRPIWTTWTTEHRHTAPARTYPRPKRRFLRPKAPFMQQEAKASTDEKRPATCRHHRPALRLYHTRPARYGQRGQYGQHTKENNRPARVVLCTPRVSVSTTEQPKASTPPEYGQRGQYGQRGHRRPPR